jgi:FeS assembly SUF system protein
MIGGRKPMRDMIAVKPQEGGASAAAASQPAPAPLVSTQAAIPAEELARITADVVRGLKTVFDPEIPVDIYELGLIYKVDLADDRLLTIDMTLTAPGCPVAGEMPGWVEAAVRDIEGVEAVKVNMVFDPPWTPARMSDEARLELGWM